MKSSGKSKIGPFLIYTLHFSLSPLEILNMKTIIYFTIFIKPYPTGIERDLLAFVTSIELSKPATCAV